MFEGLRGDIHWHLRSRHRGPKGRSGDTWARDLLRWFERDSVEHLSVKIDDPDDRGAFQLINAPLALIVESGSAEVAKGPNGTFGLLLFYHHIESVWACIRNKPEFY